MSLKNCFRPFQLIMSSSSLNKSLLTYSNSIKLVNRAPKALTNSKAFYSTEKQQNSSTETIYQGLLTKQIKAVKFFSLSSSFIGIAAQPLIYKAIVTTGSVPVIVASYAFVGFFTLVTPVLLHLITKKYVTSLTYNKQTDTYSASTVNFFLVTKNIEFKVEDIKVPEVPGMFTTLLAKGKPLFFDPRQFDSLDHYARIMGYDKPMDFKLFEGDSSPKGG